MLYKHSACPIRTGAMLYIINILLKLFDRNDIGFCVFNHD